MYVCMYMQVYSYAATAVAIHVFIIISECQVMVTSPPSPATCNLLGVLRFFFFFVFFVVAYNLQFICANQSRSLSNVTICSPSAPTTSAHKPCQFFSCRSMSSTNYVLAFVCVLLVHSQSCNLALKNFSQSKLIKIVPLFVWLHIHTYILAEITTMATF